jgi:predicted HTH transcriptional regulator
MGTITAFDDETNRLEYKRELSNSEKFEHDVVSFLNSQEGGMLYIGVDKDGTIVGLDDTDATQLAAIDRIKNNLLPTTLGLFDVATEIYDDKKVLKIIISSGAEKPYYLRKYGMSPKGCYIRVGASAQPMTTKMIDDMYAKRNRATLVNMPSPRQTLTFSQLRYYYETNGLTLGEQFERSLDLVDDAGKYNYAAYLLADDNGVSIKVAKYAGADKVDLIENEEYGYCCLLKATNRVLEKMTVENRTFAKVTSMKRLEKKMIDSAALKEAVINAVVHNDWSREVPPVVEIYSDRVTISSYGGLVEGLSQEDFFKCVSVPRNRVLMRIFKDTDMVEQLGSGMGRILKAYDRAAFEFTPNFMMVTFPFAEGFSAPSGADVGANNGAESGANNGVEHTDIILNIIAKNNAISLKGISTESGIPRRTLQREIKKLQESGKLKRIGSPRAGTWQILDKGD